MFEKKISFSIGLTGITRKEAAGLVAQVLEQKEQLYRCTKVLLYSS